MADDQVVDSKNSGVGKHLREIADSIYEWEGPIADELCLTPADVAEIKYRHYSEWKLQK